MTTASNAVVQQAHDTSLQNTEPVLVRSTIVGIITAIISILVLSGVLTSGEADVITEQLKVILPALALLGPVIAGIWSRLAAYSPRRAAAIAEDNMAAGYVAGKEGSPLPAPTLAT